jgi:glycine cleavage system H lipoate-binding protein
MVFNPALLADPSGINVDGYGDGWLFEMTCASDKLMTVDEYHQFLADNWEKTQRLIKGKINTEE